MEDTETESEAEAEAELPSDDDLSSEVESGFLKPPTREMKI